jgi:hypothetical protein
MNYLFKNLKTGEEREVSMSMKDYVPYKGKTGKENHWQRIYEAPQVSLGNTKNDPFDNKGFVEKTGKMKGSYGDLLDYSKELSDRRSEKIGKEDPLKREHFNKYEKQTGKKHLADKKKVIENHKVKIEF